MALLNKAQFQFKTSFCFLSFFVTFHRASHPLFVISHTGAISVLSMWSFALSSKFKRIQEFHQRHSKSKKEITCYTNTTCYNTVCMKQCDAREQAHLIFWAVLLVLTVNITYMCSNTDTNWNETKEQTKSITFIWI